MVDRLSPSPHEDEKDSLTAEASQSNAVLESKLDISCDTADYRIETSHKNSRKSKYQKNKTASSDIVNKPKPREYKSGSSRPLNPAFERQHIRPPTFMGGFKNASFAALDLGTNNCRLLIARPEQTGFKVIDAFSRVVRLGEGLTKSGRISDDAINRAIDALAICAQKLKRRNVLLSRSVATEACRQAVNGTDFIKKVRDETGIALDIIPSEEEARLAVLGCHVLLPRGKGPALIFDIGGGSTELVLVTTDHTIPEIIEWISVPWGVVTLTESESIKENDEEARIQAYNNMRKRVSESFREFGDRLPKYGDFRTLGTSGTITTLASVYLKLPFYSRNKIDGIHVPAEAMRIISQKLASQSSYERSLQPCIGEQRADLVVAGCAILESILDIWPTEQLGVADRGIREGILRSLMHHNGGIFSRTYS